MTLLVVGSINEDLTIRLPEFPQPGETLGASSVTRTIGGKSANQAVAAALVGAQCRLVARVGSDDGGAEALRVLGEAGVDTDGVLAGEGPTGSAFISVRDDGENTIVVVPGANAQLHVEHISEDVFDGADWLLLSLEVPLATVGGLAARARAAGVRVALNASPLPNQALDLTHVDMVVVNDGEASRLLRDQASAESARADHLGVETLVVTHGGDGATIHGREGDVVSVPGVPVRAVDTTGCGDAFAGALVGRLTRGDTVSQAGATAARFAAEAATRPGAQVSYPRDFAV
ncbi:ribokinase [Nesterenkonia sp. HG001]|uniref:ribokinase n=1 Tax=Nesterenkonia sp. HG001 TaxID=2983207 RepID=UPI002AC44BE8|nr:ribokinase [Nesterenkonia sp. HG001]MDZ5076112.1 ribokinase [Nesterenkonia sp. HG001]